MAWACADVSCQPTWQLGSASSLECGGRATLSPGNDTRINIILLMRSLKEAATSAPAAKSADEQQYGSTFFSWLGLRQALWPQPEAAPAAASSEPSCTPPSDFLAALKTDTGIPADERADLARLRAAVGCDRPVVWDAKINSAHGLEFLAYLKAADAFYAGNWHDADAGFLALRKARNPWVAETARYMPIRIGLRSAVAAMSDEYGNLDRAKVDKDGLAQARDAIADYLKAYPHGLYADSARGLVRRVLWLDGNDAELLPIYERMLANTPADSEAAADLAEEIDNRALGAGWDDAAENSLKTIRTGGKTPLLLAIVDLYDMRGDAKDLKLSQGDLAIQAGQFSSHPELHSYLVALRALQAGESPRTIMKMIPDAARAGSYTPLAFSRQMLRGKALAKAQDPNEAGFWSELIKGADPLYQRPLVELGLAIKWQRTGQVARAFAPNSPIQDATTREILLQTVASPAIVRANARDASRSAHERDVARFALIYKGLTHSAYRDVVDDLSLVPADARADGWLAPLIQQETVSLGVFTKGKWSDGFECPALRQTAATLARDPHDIHAQLCLGDFWRLNGFDNFALFAPEKAPDALGSGPDGFAGKPLARGAIYSAIIADAKAGPEERAYALYRAVMCYAPSGYNGCAGPIDTANEMEAAQVPKAQRQAWFNQLKTRYPNSVWAKRLRYFW
ncbi:hypothetical protein [Novosphingobium hassiacum]|nr:hypothetical protein [Novosphingobium hassiacum]